MKTLTQFILASFWIASEALASGNSGSLSEESNPFAPDSRSTRQVELVSSLSEDDVRPRLEGYWDVNNKLEIFVDKQVNTATSIANYYGMIFLKDGKERFVGLYKIEFRSPNSHVWIPILLQDAVPQKSDALLATPFEYFAFYTSQITPDGYLQLTPEPKGLEAGCFTHTLYGKRKRSKEWVAVDPQRPQIEGRKWSDNHFEIVTSPYGNSWNLQGILTFEKHRRMPKQVSEGNFSMEGTLARWGLLKRVDYDAYATDGKRQSSKIYALVTQIRVSEDKSNMLFIDVPPGKMSCVGFRTVQFEPDHWNSRRKR
ncbi:MAG: hypothetical protein CL677_03055 [Bdellovibrionaceae bacterium]|nr:hypothetical protein [Pseudobdellovibrionaceae bacterium]